MQQKNKKYLFKIINMKQKVIILHGRDSKDRTWENIEPQNTRHWLGWLKNELEKSWYKVFNPLISRDWEAGYFDWKNEIEKISSEIDNNTILIWTSAWAAFWVRWLSNNNKTINKLILIAPAKFPNEKNPLETKNHFYDFEINPNLKNRITNGTFILISNDEDRHIKASQIYQKELQAKLFEIPNRGHFTTKYSEENNKIPEVLNLIKKNET